MVDKKKAPRFKSATIDFVNCRCKEVSCFMATSIIQKTEAKLHVPLKSQHSADEDMEETAFLLSVALFGCFAYILKQKV